MSFRVVRIEKRTVMPNLTREEASQVALFLNGKQLSVNYLYQIEYQGEPDKDYETPFSTSELVEILQNSEVTPE